MALLKVIEWADDAHNAIVHKIDTKQNRIERGSALTVREGQVAIFCDKGRMADVFLPGYYKLDTNTLPILTTLLSWKYGFETPFKSEIYFVNTTRFSKQRWGTANPLMLRDSEFGTVRVRAYGTYSFRVKDAYVFMTELSGTRSSFATEDITDHIRSMLVTALSDALGECGSSVVDMTANLLELGEEVSKSLQRRFFQLGLELCDFNFENVSLPAELEKALDENARLGMMRKNMDVYAQMAQADAMREAAKNPGTAGTAISAGVGLGIGANMMNTFANATHAGNSSPSSKSKPCPTCKVMQEETAKFCSACGGKMQPEGKICANCGIPLSFTAKFCSECGTPTTATCAKCNAVLPANSKFCPECGEKIGG